MSLFCRFYGCARRDDVSGAACLLRDTCGSVYKGRDRFVVVDIRLFCPEAMTITGPIKATQPVVTLVGAMLVFGERLNLYQWIGVILSIASFYLLSSSGKKEGIRFTHNKWIFFTVLSILTGAASGLYDKHLMGSLDVMTVQVWFNVYQS